MPFPFVATEFETLFEPTRIWLFGKPFRSVVYRPQDMQGDRINENNEPVHMERRRRMREENRENPGPDTYRANEFRRYAFDSRADAATRSAQEREDELPMPPRRIERKLRQPDQSFARIYSFSYEGHYYSLPRPLLFLLSGEGAPPDPAMNPAVYAALAKFSGVPGQDWQFSSDILVWAVDRKDLAVCLDIEIGNYQEILLESMIASRGQMASRGDLASRGDISSRGDMASRGAGSFRGDMVGPHQKW